MKLMRFRNLIIQSLTAGCLLADLRAADAQPVDRAPSELTQEQAQLAERYERLEAAAGRLAELSEASDPGRAQQLREAIRVGREQDIRTRFDSIVKLLQEERLAAAARNQQELARQLEVLLEVLLAKPSDQRDASEQERLQHQAREVGRLIRAQRSLRAQSQSAPKPSDLAPQQGELADKARDVQRSLQPDSEKEPGKQSDENSNSSSKAQDAGQSSKAAEERKQGTERSQGATDENGDVPESPKEQSAADRAADRVAAAQQRMQQAQQKLQADDREEASAEQTAAQRELELAKEELERRLRQLREEEMQRTLLQLAARFRQMLEIQQQILQETQTLDSSFGDRRERELQVRSAALAERERRLTREADRAMLLLREDGTSVAFPEALAQIRADMEETGLRLEATKVDLLTQNLEQDIIAGLQEAVDALEKAAEQLANRQQRQQPPGSQSGGQPEETPLVEKLAELKMIRSLQVRINRRTSDLAEIIHRSQATAEEVEPLLKKLAGRQAKIAAAARDLHAGRND